MHDERFQAPASFTQCAELWAEWGRIYGPRFSATLGMQHAALEDLCSYTGKTDPRELTDAEARLYTALLRTRPKYQAISEAEFERGMARF